MRNLSFFLGGLAATAAVAATDLGKEIGNEIGVQTSFNLLLRNPSTSSSSDLSGTYHYTVHRNLQLGAGVSFSAAGLGINGTKAADVNLGLSLIPTFNFGGSDLREDFFLRTTLTFGWLAFVPNILGPPFSTWTLGFQAGKRFRLLQNLSYSPNISFAFPLSSVGNTSLVVNFFAFSALF